MVFESQLLEFSDIQLIDGDRGKNYPKHDDFINSGDCLFLSAKNVTPNGFEFSDTIFINKEKDAQLRAGKLELGDIVVTTRGTIGNVALYDETVGFEHIRINSGMMIFRANPEVWNYRFLYFILTSGFIRKQIETLTSGSAVPQLPAKDLKKFKLPKVSKDIQDVIADNVGTLVDKITLNRQINQTLEQMAQTLFKSWFVDFDPVIDNALDAGNDIPDTLQERAEQRRLLRAKADFKPLPAETRALFPSEFEETELGWVPKGWEISLSGDLIDVRDGTHDSPQKSDTGYPLVTSKHITTGVLNLSDAYLISKEDYEKANQRSKVSTGDILLTMIGTVGIPYFVAEKNVEFAIKNIGLFRTSANQCLQYYFFELLKSNGMQNYLESRLAGTTQKYLSLKELRNIPFLVPSEKCLNLFNESSASMSLKIQHNTKEIYILSNLRDSLLPKLISGELALDALPEAPELAESR